MKQFLVILSALLFILASVCCSTAPLGEPPPADPLPVASPTPVAIEVIIADPPQSLAAELSPDLWASITAAFDYLPVLTDHYNAMGADLTVQMPALHDVQAWVFTHLGDVAAAFAALDIPAEAEAIPPYELTLDQTLDLYLEAWAPELESARGTDWIADAQAQVPAWAEHTQTLGEFNFTVEAYPGAVEAEIEDEDPYVTWAFSVFSPMVDLDALEIIPGTYLVILRFQFAY